MTVYDYTGGQNSKWPKKHFLITGMSKYLPLLKDCKNVLIFLVQLMVLKLQDLEG